MKHLKPLLFNLLWTLPALGMDSKQDTTQATIKTFTFITWAVSQGAFQQAGIPQELRHKLIEDVSREYVDNRQKFIKEIFTIDLSFKDILYLSTPCLNGIRALNTAKTMKVADELSFQAKISGKISEEDYCNTQLVPLHIKLRFLQKKESPEEYMPAYHTISARVLVGHPTLKFYETRPLICKRDLINAANNYCTSQKYHDYQREIALKE